jgi:hypothetical protein
MPLDGLEIASRSYLTVVQKRIGIIMPQLLLEALPNPVRVLQEWY